MDGSRLMRRAAVAALVLMLAGGGAQAGNFENWVAGLWPQARAKGVSKATFAKAFNGVTPDPEVIRSANHQPEFERPVSSYIATATSDKRIAKGQARLAEYANLLNAIEAMYGVDRHIVMAIWGMESAYGEKLGELNVVRSLATLGYQGRRSRFGKSQLIAALQILERGDTSPDRMTGSWAGAMGHTQFIPTTYAAYAVDFDGDGRRDIWDTIPDALASTANYLRKSGWQRGKPWGYEVVLPSGFNYRLAGGKWRSVRSWANLGVRAPGGRGLPHPGDSAGLILPAGASGPAFLVFRNFKAILRYNNATIYALAVGHLADRLRGGGRFVADWPADEFGLGDDQRRELQGLLAARGYEIGEVDGIIGSKTRDAIRLYQASAGLAEDGHPSPDLLNRLKRN